VVYQIIAVFLIIAFIDIRDLLQVKSNKIVAFLVYGLLFFSGALLSYLLAIDKAPISPAVIIDKIIGFILGR